MLACEWRKTAIVSSGDAELGRQGSLGYGQSQLDEGVCFSRNHSVSGLQVGRSGVFLICGYRRYLDSGHGFFCRSSCISFVLFPFLSLRGVSCLNISVIVRGWRG